MTDTPLDHGHFPGFAVASGGRAGRLVRWLHATVALVLALAGALLSWQLSGRLPPELFQSYAADVWFQADLIRVVENMTDAHSSHYRNKVHPIASLVVYPPAKLLQALHPMPDLAAARVLSAFCAAAWVAVLYALLIALGLPASAAAAFGVLGLCSASFVMFFSVPELYHLGSLSMMAVLLAAALAVRRGIGERAVTALGMGSLAITTTNWMAGLALAFTHLPWRRALRCSAWVLGLTIVLAIVQKLVFPTSGLFFLLPAGEALYIGREEAGTAWHRLAGLLLHPIVLPDLRILQPANDYLWPMLSVQFSVPGGSRATGLPALALWIALFAAGLCGARRLGSRHRRLLLVLFGTLAGQFALHLVYGEETFLYSLHVLPFLLAVAALAWFTRLRPLVAPVVLLLALLAGLNNLRGFEEAESKLAGFLTERERLKRAMAARPGDAWPRSEGHVVLGGPGTPLAQKGFHEPGGSFSPGPGSFGVSIWITDADGRRIVTSDTVPLQQVQQSFVPVPGQAVPALATATPHYRARWSWDAGRFQLALLPARDRPHQRAWLLLRSAGPSGGPLHAIRREPWRLVLNDRWEVAMAGTGLARLGDEDRDGIDLVHPLLQPVGLRSRDAADLVDTAGEGWLYAAVPVPPDGVVVRIADLASPPGRPLPVQARHWTLAVPDDRFAAMAHAQQAHLLMGLTDRGTRPGEPVSYEAEWARDGAYVVAALARAGQADTVRRLAVPLAEHDFLGGFGAEGDAPALAIWALGEAARAVDDPRFDAWAWPHVRRKAGLVVACLTARHTMVVPPSGPVLPAYRHDPLTHRPCEPAQGGLAMARMHHHYPVLFANAVNYLGLREAAALARRVGELSEAADLERRAEALAQAWRTRFLATPRDAARQLLDRVPDLLLGVLAHDTGLKRRVAAWLHAPGDERTYGSALWPSGVLGTGPGLRTAYEARLQARWRRERDEHGGFRQAPDCPAFHFAEAHQWLALGRPEQAWKTLSWFMAASASPGLYSWWEETGEQNASHRWVTVRGWTDGRRITPHYRSAAEALMLQMAMLVHVDRASPGAPLVVGAGVPREWLAHRIDSGAIVTDHGPVRWVWEDGRLTVDVARPGVEVRLAPVFDSAPVLVRHAAPTPGPA